MVPGRPALDNGYLRIAAMSARAALQDDPYAAEHHATLAAALLRMGDYSRAWNHVDLARGAEFYEDEVAGLEAELWRTAGEPARALALRESWGWTSPDAAQQWVELARDAHAAGEPKRAWEALSQARAWGSTCAVEAVEGLLLDDPETAEVQLHLARREADCPEAALLESILEPDPRQRAVVLAVERSRWPWDPELTAALSRARFEAGDDGCRVLADKYAVRSEHPEVAALRGRCPSTAPDLR